MVWWWIGNIVLIGVVIPVVLLLANRVLRPVQEIDAYVKDTLEHGVAVTHELDAVPALVETRELTATARRNLARYVAAVERML